MLVLVFFILRPFMTAILFSIVVTYIFYPFYRFLNKRLKNKNLSALIVVILVILVITLPLFFTLNAVSREARINYLLIKQKITSGKIFDVQCKASDAQLCKLITSVEGIMQDPHTRYYLETGIQRITEYLVNNTSNFLLSIPLTVLNFFVVILLIFYLSRDGESLLNKFMDLSPLRRGHQLRIIGKFKEVIRAVVYGHIIIAIIGGIITVIGFYLANVAAPILWGLVVILLAFIPFIGPPVVWIPAFLIKISEGANLQATIILIVGVILMFTDYFLKPKVVGDRAKIHPVLVLFGAIGGLMIFGFIGVLVGPVVIALLVTLLQIYKEEHIPLVS